MVDLKNVKNKEEKIIENIMDSHGYDELKNTQKQAFNEGVLNKGSHLLIAETGNGKTLCAEAVAKKHLNNKNNIAYLVPSTQLVRDKKETIEEWTDESISTGSGKYTDDNNIVIATYNSFYQAIIRNVGNVRNYDLVILDDFHELYGTFIGPGIEKSIAAIKQYDAEIFGISATIGNPSEVSEWLDSRLTVSNETRSIPIEENIGVSSYNSKKEATAEFVSKLSNKKPILVFNYAKSWAESRAKEISNKTDYSEPETNFRDKIKSNFDGTVPNSMKDLMDIIDQGVAYHHSSIPVEIREIIEDMYFQNEIKCISATTTIAYGFDAPVQSVVVADMRRRGNWIGKWEYQQWIGRAARPGYGYDKGYAYIITNNEDKVKCEFFEPRELEPVDSHIDNTTQFRKFILELISMGWNTPDEIEEFISETLFWTKIETKGSWGRSFNSKNQQVMEKLKQTVKWLEYNGFIRESRTERKFESTDKGDATVRFIFQTNISPKLKDIDQFYSWISSNKDMCSFEYLSKLCDTFSIGLNKNMTDKNIQSKIRDINQQVNSDTMTAGIIDKYWTSNTDLNKIEEEVDVNTAYLSNISYRISKTLRSSSNLIETQMNKPKWLDDYSYQIQRGIKLDSIPYIRNIDGLGRLKIRNLRNNLSKGDKSLYDQIEDVLNNKSETEFIDNLCSDVDGISGTIGKRIVDYHKNDYIQEKYKNNQTENKNSNLDNFY